MLRYLRIRNLAVIEALEVEFEPGFNVLSGETGAGKSILIEAVGLLLGGRGSADLVRTGESQATIEALFDPSDAARLAGDGELVVRREISAQGRSRSFINGALATAAALRDLAGRLVELHGQHEHQSLLDPLTHLPLLDDYANLGDLCARVAVLWTSLKGLRDELDRSRMDDREKAARLELIAFQLGEIGKAAPLPGEDEELAVTRQVLLSAERVLRLCEEGYTALYESDHAVLAGLGTVWKRVGELATLDVQFQTYLDARDGIKGQLEDLALFLRDYAQGIDASPAKLQQVEDRFAVLERLKRKYGPTLHDVIARGHALAHERTLLTGAGERLGDLEQELATATARYLATARELSARRRSAAPGFAARIEDLLAELAMTRTRFQVRFNDAELPETAWGETGIDTVEFFVSPNPGEELRPLARIISGGELSRVMLALKTLAAGDPVGKTLIFDEVDAGVGGRVADVVGNRLRALSQQFQVLCITHLPQIAAHATTQFRVEKTVRDGRTLTAIERLTDESRVTEIARMLVGSADTPEVRASAEQLIVSAVQRAQSGRGAKDERTAKAKGESRRRG
jgi:DNA repair protein RecN (Recombination protein N)